MSLYLYAPTSTETVTALQNALDAKRLRKFDGMNFLFKGRPIEFVKADTIVCWGAHVPNAGPMQMLNQSLLYRDQKSINISLLQIAQRAYPNHFGATVISLMRFDTHGFDYDKLLKSLQRGKYAKLVPYAEFPGYGTKFYKFTEQYKFHVFNGKILQAGIKVTNLAQDPWYTYDWTHVPTPEITNAALLVAKHIGMDFCVLNLDMLNGSLCLRKVVTAPVLTPELLPIYVKAIKEYAGIKTE